MPLIRTILNTMSLGGKACYGVAWEFAPSDAEQNSKPQLAFVLDRSASLYGGDWLDAIIEAVRTVCARIEPGPKVSVDLFAERWTPLAEAQPSDSSALLAALWKVKEAELGSGTSFEAAAGAIAARLESTAGKLELVLVTDAQPTEQELALPVFAELAARKIRLHILALKPRELPRLKSLAESSSGHQARALQAKDVRAALEGICTHYFYQARGDAAIDLEWPEAFAMAGLMRVSPPPQLFYRDTQDASRDTERIRFETQDGRCRLRARLPGASGVVLLALQEVPDRTLQASDLQARDEQLELVAVQKAGVRDGGRWSTWQRMVAFLFAASKPNATMAGSSVGTNTGASATTNHPSVHPAGSGSTLRINKSDLTLAAIEALATSAADTSKTLKLSKADLAALQSPAPVDDEPMLEQGEPVLHVDLSEQAALSLEGATVSTEFRFTNSRLLIGRYDFFLGNFPDVDLSLFDPDRTVSREHALLERTPEGYYLTDLGATNGTWVGTQAQILTPGEKMRVKPGEPFLCGNVRLHLRLLASTAAAS